MVLSVCVLPKMPLAPDPHTHTVPSAFSAAATPSAATTSTTPVNPLTGTGRLLDDRVPWPSCPSLPRPQAQTVPSLRDTTTKSAPTATRGVAAWAGPMAP